MPPAALCYTAGEQAQGEPPMRETLTRARELLPAIIITVLSMIQALALELFWGRFQEADYLWLGGPDAMLGWLQFATVLLGIIEIWLLYVSLMLRFSWIPSMADTTVPFAIGLLEFMSIDLTGRDTLGPWFLTLGAMFALILATTRVMLRKARRDPANAWFFANIPGFKRGDYFKDVLLVVVLLGLGGLLWALDSPTWLAMGSIMLGFTALMYQVTVTHRFWLPYREEDDVPG